MGTSGLWHEIKSDPLALGGAIVLHVVLIVVLSINLSGTEVHVPRVKQQETMEAVLIDTAKLEAERKKKEQQELAARRQEQERIAAEKKRAAAQKRKQAETQKQLAAEQQRKEAERQQLQQKQEAERRAAELQRIEAEKQRKAEAARIAEQKRKQAEKREAERRQREAEEAARLAEIKRKQEEEARRRQAEEELRRKLAEEERLEREAREAAARAAELDRMLVRYIAMIEQKVERSWRRPASLRDTPECVVHVTQDRLGEVLGVKLRDCRGEPVYLRSIEQAVRRASPLPTAPDPDLFDREILFTFRPG